MRKKKTNRFDLVVDKLINEFVKIPNFDLTKTDHVANQIFNQVAFRLSDITAYKDLVCSHFIPATNRAIFSGKKDIQQSKYKQYFKISDLDFKETLNDTIRLSYVGLFHKLENYLNDVIKITNLIFGDIYETDGTIEEWAKEKFEFKIKNWRQFYITQRINWIANCVKHKDGFPIKEPIPSYFKHLDKNKRIELTKDDFRKDCETLIEFYPTYLSIMFIIAQHKMIFEKELKEDDYKDSPDLYQKIIIERNNAQTTANDIISSIKSFETFEK